MDVHLRELRYFVAVAEHLHFGRAAESLFVSQPALSKQIRTLERQLRVRLFVRDRHTVRLTAAGTALLPRAREVLAAWEQAEDALAAASAESAATLTVGINTGIGRGMLPAVRARFEAAAPTARLLVRQVAGTTPPAA
jgi:DNA-binding transcriptional LysR family regulator